MIPVDRAARLSPREQTKKFMSLLIPPMLGTLIWIGGSTVGIILVILIIVVLVR
jgi:hypothetical protein